VRGTLGTLAERIPASEARELALHLPDGLMPEPDGAGRRREAFDARAFVARVARRTGVPEADAEQDARAVLTTVAEALPPEEVEYLRAVLSADYAPLLGDAPLPGAAGPEPATSRC
jgi:uncharacterized protein (DUF2267 family)